LNTIAYVRAELVENNCYKINEWLIRLCECFVFYLCVVIQALCAASVNLIKSIVPELQVVEH